MRRTIFPAFLILSGCVFSYQVASAQSSGLIAIEGLSSIQKPQDPVAAHEERLVIDYNRRFRLSRSWGFRFHPWLQATTTPEAWDTPFIADPRELYLEYDRRGFFFRAGFVTLRWEGTDGVNPMDIASVKDYGDPLNAPTKASAGVHLGRAGENFDWEVLYVPRQTKSSLPGEESAWLPRQLSLPLRSDEIELRLPNRVEYQYLDRGEVDSAKDHNYGARVQARGDWGDAAVAFFEGASESPYLRPVVDVTPIQVSPKEIYLLQSPVKLIPVDYRRRTVAGFLSTMWGEWIFRASARYDQPLSSGDEFSTWSAQSVAGLERSVEIFGDSVTFVLQGAWAHRPDDASLLSIQDLFDQAVLLGVRWPVGESWTVFVSGLRSGKDGSMYGSGEVSYRLTDSISTKVFAQLIDGPSDSLGGILSQNDRLGLQISYSF